MDQRQEQEQRKEQRQEQKQEFQQQQQQALLTQQDILIIKHDVNKLTDTVKEVHQALVGNSVSKDGGLVQRVISLESDAELLSTRIEIVEKLRVKADLYVRILWTAGGAVIGAILITIVKGIFDK